MTGKDMDTTAIFGDHGCFVNMEHLRLNWFMNLNCHSLNPTPARRPECMKRLKREIRLWLYSVFMGLAIQCLPRDCSRTIEWLEEMPFED
jgi:hypothetical protein